MRKELLWSAMLAGAMLVGCNKDDTTATAPVPPKPQPAPSADMGKTAEPMKDSGKSMSESPKSMADPAKDATPSAKDNMTATAAPTTAPAAMDAADAEAKLTKVMGYINDHKYDLADSTLKELEAHKSSLPTDLQPKVDNARKMLDAAKAGGMSMPGMTK